MRDTKPTNIGVLDELIKKDGIAEYIHDHNSALSGNLNILYSQKDFYIAEETTYQPWLSIIGHVPQNSDVQKLYSYLLEYIKKPEYIAAYTNIPQISEFLQKTGAFSYHEDFIVALLSDYKNADEKHIRLATENDLPYIENTYKRSGHAQLLSRIKQKQMWVLEEDNCVKGYAGIHKDNSLGFEYVDPAHRRQNVASRLQFYIAKNMTENGLTPYVMLSKDNTAAINLQTKLKCTFANELFYFYAKGAYEFE